MNHSGRNCCESADSLFWNYVKSRQFKFGHWREVRGKQEERSESGEGQVARDINWESGQRRDFKIDEEQRLELVQGGPGHASQCQPFTHQLNAQLFLTNLLTHSDGMQPISQTSILTDIVQIFVQDIICANQNLVLFTPWQIVSWHMTCSSSSEVTLLYS